VDISSRSWGSLVRGDWKGRQADIAADDLNLEAFDAVLGGSVRGAHIEAVNEAVKTKEGGMSWKEVIEGLKKENPGVFDAYEKDMKESLSAEFEKKIMAEVKKAKVEENELREKIEAEINGENAELIANLEAIEKWLDAGRPLFAFEGKDGDGKDKDKDGEDKAALKKVQEDLAKLQKAADVEKAKSKELSEQLADRDRQDAVKKKIVEVTSGKERGTLIAERLADCKTIEEVEQRANSEEEFIKKLLMESHQPAGDGKVRQENDKDSKWTPEQRQQRASIGLPTD